MKTIRVSPRFTLPGEIVMGIVGTAWGIGGDLGSGHIHNLLAEKSDLSVWTLLFMVSGLAMFITAIHEYTKGGNWNDVQLHRSVSIRACSHFVNFFTWIYGLKLLFDLDGARVALSLACMALPLSMCSAWFFYETLRVRYALDHRHNTPKLVVRR